MWGKTTDTPSATRPEEFIRRQTQPAPPMKMTSSIGKTIRILGDMSSDEEIFLDGELEGTLQVRGRLTIGPNGKVKATVKTKDLIVKGRIDGNVEALERVQIMNGASILGDVRTAGIVIEDGAFFKGGIDILRPEAKPEPVAAHLVAK